jgi:uncharacterized CHY-type Zn-finger protein
MKLFKKYLTCGNCNKRYGTDYGKYNEDKLCPYCTPKKNNLNRRIEKFRLLSLKKGYQCLNTNFIK